MIAEKWTFILSTIKGLGPYCVLQESQNENEFHISASPTPRVSNDVTFGHAHTLCSAIWLLL